MRQGAQLLVKPRSGLSLRASPEVRQRLQAELQQMKLTPSFRAEERVLYLLFLLVTGPGETTLGMLQANLGVSRSTLSRDLHQAEGRLSAKGLILKYSRHRGFCLLGSEVAQRHLSLEILLHSGLNRALAELITRGKLTSSCFYTCLQQVLLDEVKTWPLVVSYRLVARLERELSLNLSDDDVLFLTLYWALTLRRLQGGHTVSHSERSVEVLISAQEFACVEDLIASFALENNVHIPRDEIFQFLVEIKACQGELTLMPQSTVMDESKVGCRIAEQMLKRLGDRLGYNLCNADILDQMSLHLTRALARLRAGLPLYNPLTQEVQRAYPHLWATSLEDARDIGMQYGLIIPEEEVAYLVMYLALAIQLAERAQQRRVRVVVVCPTGGVMARLLVHRLQTALPEIEVVESVPLRGLARLDVSRVDLVISTVKLTAGRLPVVTVNPLLGEGDLQRIRSQIAQLQTSQNSVTQRECEACR
ncbi:MAG: PRD domain-containing protein [Anaerolineales bacterium]|nr:PRD domain-containing protein [Anaerolineales bacterium]MDW8162445.1 PRD domain-containing protein [Anaerolineales bacterium]